MDEDKAKGRETCEPRPRSAAEGAATILRKMRNEAEKIGNSVRANALADALVVLEEVM